MNSYVSWFLQGLILVPVTLLPIINPLSSAPVFAATVGSNRSIAQRLARQVAVNAWFVLVASMLIGTYVLALFGISLPVVRIGGGLLVAATAWHMLHHTEDDDVHAVAAENAATLSDAEIVQRSFFPITFPLTRWNRSEPSGSRGATTCRWPPESGPTSGPNTRSWSGSGRFELPRHAAGMGAELWQCAQFASR
jgi:hypothetical protein